MPSHRNPPADPGSRRGRPVGPGLLLLALAAAAPLPAPPAAAQEERRDLIWKNTGGVIRAWVVSESLKEVAFQHQKNLDPQKIATDEVRAIEYADKPSELEEGESRTQQRDYENAVNVLKVLLSKKDLRDVHRMYARFHLAEALRLWGRTDPARVDEAHAAYKELLQSFPQTRFKPQAVEGMVRCLLEKKDLKAAEKEGTEFEKMAFGDWNSDRWVARAKLLNGEILEAAGQHGEAVSKYETLEKFARSKKLDEFANEALTRVGMCHLRKGDVSAAERHFQRIVDGLRPDSPRSLGASALVGLGHALMTKKAYRDAREAYVRALVLYFGDEERSAEAALGAGRATEALAEDGQEKDARSRAQAYYSMVVERYPGTKAAAEARKLVK